MSTATTTTAPPRFLPFLVWGGVLLISVLALLGTLQFGYGPGDYYYASVSIFAAALMSVICLRASAEVRLILTLLGTFYLLFLIAKVSIIRGGAAPWDGVLFF